MKFHKNTMLMWIISMIIISSIGVFCIHNPKPVYAQSSTQIIPTVTSSPMGAYITVRPQEQDQINVRSGPATSYPKVGVLLIGQKMAAKGRSAGGDWILIEYPGVAGGEAWVYAPLVNLVGGELPIVAPPATPTPLYTPTVDPTLEARYIITEQPTSLPTFTQPPQLIIPTIPNTTEMGMLSRVPLGLIIIVMASAGLLIGIIAFIQNR